jgi:putative transcriptional regulator
MGVFASPRTVHLATNSSAAKSMERTRFIEHGGKRILFLEYTDLGSDPGQLQAEIEEGAWYVLPAEPSDAFCPEPEHLWPAVLRRQGGELAYVATYPDDPGLN